MPRKARYLTRNHGTEAPSNLLFFDTECYKRPHPTIPNKSVLSLRLWAATRLRLDKGKVTRRTEHNGTEPAAFWQLVRASNRNDGVLWVFAHNLGFDLTQTDFWGELDNARFNLNRESVQAGDNGEAKIRSSRGQLCIENFPTYCIVYSQGRKYNIVDTANYWPVPLRLIGKSLGISKGRLPADTDNQSDWLSYCKRDVSIIERAVINLMEQWRSTNSGVFKFTSAALAMTNFQHLCDIRTPQEKAVDIVCDPNAEYHAMERDSYYGGRTNCYFVGSVVGRVYHLDVNSLYPFVMATNSFPRRYAGYRKEMSNGELSARLRYWGVVANVLIESREATFPIRIDGRQYHCNGKYWTTLCGPELQRAVDSECIVKTNGVQWYSQAPLFTKWVNHWYDIKTNAKRKGDSGLAEHEFAKLVLNSLTGKWAQRSFNWRDRPSQVPSVRWGGFIGYHPETYALEKCRGIAGHKQVKMDGEEPRHSFPLISAYITAHGREYMRRIINSCPPGSVYYMATDSLICDGDAYDVLQKSGYIDEYAIGKLKIVGQHTECEIFGPNHYRLDKKTVAAGVLGKYIISQKQNRAVEVWEQLQSIVSRKPDGTVIVTEIPVKPVTPDFRGTIGEDGYWNPLRLSFDPDFTDSPPRDGYSFRDSQDMEAGRILVTV